jgi:hypothetical protein
LRNFNNFVDSVRLWPVDDLLHWVGHVNLLANFDFNWDINTALNNLLHGVWHWAINDLLHRVWDTLFHNLFHGVRNWPINDFLHRVGDLHMLDNPLVHGDRHLHHFLNKLLNWNRDILCPYNLMGNGNINCSHNFMWNGDFDTDWNWDLPLHLDHLLHNTVYWNLHNTLNNLFDRHRDAPFDDLLNWVWHLHGFNNRDIIWLLNSSLDDLLHRVWNTGLNNSLHCMWNWDVNDLVHWVWDLDSNLVRHWYVVHLLNIHCPNDLIRGRDVH